MTQFTTNSSRIDPYKNFKFRVHWAGQSDPVAGISKISEMERTTEVVSHREGNDISSPRYSPGSTKYEAITLERGVTFDTDFEAWANRVHSTKGDASVSLANFRRDMTIQLLNLQGTVVRSYNVFRCWVSEYVAMPELDANSQAIAIERIVIQNEGWERDIKIRETKET